MLSSLLRTKKGRRRVQEHSPFSSPFAATQTNQEQSSPLLPKRPIRHAAADFTTETEDSITHSDEDANDVEEDVEQAEDNDDDIEEEEEDGDEEDTPLLPIFSAAHLDSLPVYSLTHAIRLIVLQRCETSLTFDQLRSPQVSQFLVKPIQQNIRTNHFSRATLYALLANCLQFSKEMSVNPGNSGVCKTRAMVCELLAIKLLKEYNTRELIDALSYDFFPLQGLQPSPPPQTPIRGGNSNWQQLRPPTAARTSTLEVAIRAQAKKFLAHPLVVQQLEAIWAGTIVFHSAADNLHRPQIQQAGRVLPGQRIIGNRGGYGTTTPIPSPTKLYPPKQRDQVQAVVICSSRRRVTLYDPRDASLFKLSRLRVPRYRQFLSTLSLAVLLGLLVTVLASRSTEITTLEVVFWFWSAGFMLDELVGFNEQGFSLYIMSFWNIFDASILLLLILYYGMRLYGLFLSDLGRQQWNSMAYDVLAANAVLLFPRLFSVLDHYRYFSQLLIAFRLMFVDLLAVFVLVIICCSGFFVAFTLSFGRNQYNPGAVGYDLFRLLMGFTPVAWEAWPQYNILGKILLVVFLFVTHFLIITILITILTNSLMAITNNANEEHQFLFAVNTISMVKNDALFSYVAPTNIFAWMLAPLRYMMPFRRFISINRTIIKITHFPLLFSIFAYEKVVLARTVFEPTDLVMNRGREKQRFISFHDPVNRGLFSPAPGGRNFRQESVAGFQKDRALDEVFRLAPDQIKMRSSRKSHERRRTSNVVNNWMDEHEGIASPPPEQDRAVVDRLETGRPRNITTAIRRFRRLSGGLSGTRSVASDPEDFMSTEWGPYGSRRSLVRRTTSDLPSFHENAMEEDEEQGEDGDDELATHDEDENATLDKRSNSRKTASFGGNNNQGSDKENDAGDEDYFTTPTAVRYGAPFPGAQMPSSFTSSPPKRNEYVKKETPPKKPSRVLHTRNTSNATILYNPVMDTEVAVVAVGESSAGTSLPKFDTTLPPTKYTSRPVTAKRTPAGSGTNTPSGRRSPKRSIYTLSRDKQPSQPISAASSSKARPTMPTRDKFQTVPDRAGIFGFQGISTGNTTRLRQNPIRHRRSSMDMIGDITSEMGLADNNQNIAGGLSSSFQTQMWEMQREKSNRNKKHADRVGDEDDDGSGRLMGRLMLARMKTLEEGFRDVVREVKGMRQIGVGTTSASGTVANYSPIETGVSSAGGGGTGGRRSSGAGITAAAKKQRSSKDKKSKEKKKEQGSGSGMAGNKSLLKGEVRLEDWGLPEDSVAAAKEKEKEKEVIDESKMAGEVREEEGEVARGTSRSRVRAEKTDDTVILIGNPTPDTSAGTGEGKGKGKERGSESLSMGDTQHGTGNEAPNAKIDEGLEEIGGGGGGTGNVSGNGN